MPELPEISAAQDEPAVQAIWALLLGAAAACRAGVALEDKRAYGLDAAGAFGAMAADEPDAILEWRGGWRATKSAPSALLPLLELYLPICGASARAPLTVGHLGQSLDGFIATTSGDSNYVTGPANILHLHRMRALCDAVLVGAETVATDDPRLTTRRADGRNPVRVILDPQLRLASGAHVFTDDSAATLIVCEEARARNADLQGASVELIGLPSHGRGLDLARLLEALRARSLNALFVEGGGKTVTAFFEQDALDRLQIAIAPIVLGEGRPGLRIATRDRLGDCPRLAPRVFRMGEDLLFDCDLRAGLGPSQR